MICCFVYSKWCLFEKKTHSYKTHTCLISAQKFASGKVVSSQPKKLQFCHSQRNIPSSPRFQKPVFFFKQSESPEGTNLDCFTLVDNDEVLDPTKKSTNSQIWWWNVVKFVQVKLKKMNIGKLLVHISMCFFVEILWDVWSTSWGIKNQHISNWHGVINNSGNQNQENQSTMLDWIGITLGGGFKYLLFSPRSLGKWSNLTIFFF